MHAILEWLLDLDGIRLGRDAPLFLRFNSPIPAWLMFGIAIVAALVIVVPLILPVAVGYGIDPVHRGIIFLANMQIGYCTPPVGMNLFIASYRFDKSIVLLYRSALPFLAILFLTVLIITYWPWLSLVLVR